MSYESRRLLAADVSAMTRVDLPNTFGVNGSGQYVNITGAQLGTVTFLGSDSQGIEQFQYTPNTGSLGVDHLVVHYQQVMVYPGYGMYTYQSQVTVDMSIYLPVSPTEDRSASTADYETGVIHHNIEYFVLEGNTLSVTADEGVLVNDTAPDLVQYLTAQKVSDGQYGTVSVSGDGAFSYTPHAGVFDNPYASVYGITDVFQYKVLDPQGFQRGVANVFVKLFDAKVTFGGTDIDPNTAIPDVWVGQPVPVTLSGVGGRPIIQWSIEGDTFKEYRIDTPNEMSEVIELTAAELKATSLTFHWVAEDGTRKASVSGRTGYLRQNISETIDIEVHRPNVTINAKTGSLGKYQIGGALRLGLGGIAALGSGIEFRAEGDTSLGTFSWLQLVDASISSGVNGEGLDTSFPYNDEDEGVVPISTTDNPWVRLNGPGTEGWTSASYNADFCMNLMWKSPVAGSQYVPLRYLDWSVDFSATRLANGEWEIDDDSTWSVFNWDQTGVDRKTHPTWTNVVTVD